MAERAMILPERLLDRRRAAGIGSEGELARIADVSQQTINRLMTKPQAVCRSLPKIAAALGTSSDYLRGLTADPEPIEPSEEQSVQHAMLAVALPGPVVVIREIEAMLAECRGRSQTETAREIARRLPDLLRLPHLARSRRLPGDG